MQFLQLQFKLLSVSSHNRAVAGLLVLAFDVEQCLFGLVIAAVRRQPPYMHLGALTGGGLQVGITFRCRRSANDIHLGETFFKRSVDVVNCLIECWIQSGDKKL